MDEDFRWKVISCNPPRKGVFNFGIIIIIIIIVVIIIIMWRRGCLLSWHLNESLRTLSGQELRGSQAGFAD